MKEKRFRSMMLGICMLAGCGELSGSLLAPWVGPNVRLGEDPPVLPEGNGQNQAEPHAIRSITDPDLVLATFQEGRFSNGGAFGNGYAVSEDGGFTWHRALNPRLTLIQGGPYYRATDPVAGIDRDGTLYLNSLVALDENFDLGRLVIQRSDDRGHTWTDPITIYTGRNPMFTGQIFPDKNWMVVDDYEASPHPGRVIVTWTDFRTFTVQGERVQDYLIMCSHSDDRGVSWSDPVFVTPSAGIELEQLKFQGSQPVFLPGGGLAVVYHSFLLGQLQVSYSRDGGETFPHGRFPVHDGYLLFDTPNMRDGSFLPSVAVARETGDLYIVYTSRESILDQSGQIYFVRSNLPNPGTSPVGQPNWRFTAPIQISGLDPDRIVSLATISVTPDGNRVTVYFYDNRNGSGVNDSGDFYCVQSLDGGQTWSSAFRLTEEVFPLNRATSTSRGYMIGDYFGFAPPLASDQVAVAVWVDTRDGTADPWSARIADLAQPVFDSWLQANLPYAGRMLLGSDPVFADPDGDANPLMLEYMLGLSPLEEDLLPSFADEFSLQVLNPATDPDVQITLQSREGDWPVPESQPLGQQPEVSSFGEGYWDRFTWQQGSIPGHISLTLENGASWYLLKESAPSRWALDIGGGWLWTGWFGSLYPDLEPWLFHENLGWLYDMKGVFYSDALSAYLFPERLTYPWVFKHDGGYLYVSESGSWVYETGSSTWQRTW